MNIHTLLKFTKLHHKFAQTKRYLYATGEDRKENDAEHSFQVALTCWYLNESHNLKLNMEKVFKYALAHDILEAYTGDFHFNDIKERLNKEKLEKEALEKFRIDFKEFKEIFKTIEKYNNLIDKESKFVNAVEKLIPLLNIYLDNGRLWKEEGMTYEIIEKNKDPKIAISPLPDMLWQELKPILKESGYLL